MGVVLKAGARTIPRPYLAQLVLMSVSRDLSMRVGTLGAFSHPENGGKMFTGRFKTIKTGFKRNISEFLPYDEFSKFLCNMFICLCSLCLRERALFLLFHRKLFVRQFKLLYSKAEMK